MIIVNEEEIILKGTNEQVAIEVGFVVMAAIEKFGSEIFYAIVDSAEKYLEENRGELEIEIKIKKEEEGDTNE